MDSIISMEKTLQQLNDAVVVDCRFALGQPLSGRNAYAAGHLPGAIYMDLEEDLSGPKTTHGGRHPLPDWGAFVDKLGAVGITRDSLVIAYDDQGGAMASRFWWMLTYLGHGQVAVMDGGFTAWVNAGYPVTTDVPQPQPAEFTAEPQPELLASVGDVRNAIGSGDITLIDSREEKRYLGLEEPIDKVAGHIPGARNAFWKDSLTPTGTWKKAPEQQARFEDLDKDRPLIVYCGSGVTACPNVLALREAGFRNVKLYAGSWSDWISYEENPIATGKE